MSDLIERHKQLHEFLLWRWRVGRAVGQRLDRLRCMEAKTISLKQKAGSECNELKARMEFADATLTRAKELGYE